MAKKWKLAILIKLTKIVNLKKGDLYHPFPGCGKMLTFFYNLWACWGVVGRVGRIHLLRYNKGQIVWHMKKQKINKIIWKYLRNLETKTLKIKKEYVPPLIHTATNNNNSNMIIQINITLVFDRKNVNNIIKIAIIVNKIKLRWSKFIY